MDPHGSQLSEADEGAQPVANLTHRQAAFVADRTARATERLVERTPTGLESFARSTLSTATAIVLAGVVLILIADMVNLVDEVDVWPLVSLATLIAAVASALGFAGWRERAASLAHDVAAPWRHEERFDSLETKIDELHRAVSEANRRP